MTVTRLIALNNNAAPVAEPAAEARPETLDAGALLRAGELEAAGAAEAKATAAAPDACCWPGPL